MLFDNSLDLLFSDKENVDCGLKANDHEHDEASNDLSVGIADPFSEHIQVEAENQVHEFVENLYPIVEGFFQRLIMGYVAATGERKEVVEHYLGNRIVFPCCKCDYQGKSAQNKHQVINQRSKAFVPHFVKNIDVLQKHLFVFRDAGFEFDCSIEQVDWQEYGVYYGKEKRKHDRNALCHIHEVQGRILCKHVATDDGVNTCVHVGFEQLRQKDLFFIHCLKLLYNCPYKLVVVATVLEYSHKNLSKPRKKND